ncbi:MAG: hypothetical protein JWP74_2153 [Marmoricola sp.]|nr:hypothetical protein [Marmoricola sp.]
MTTLASRTIDALRQEHDGLAVLVSALSPDQLAGPSGASEWSVAQVLSHLGSGSEISLAGLQVALGEREAPDDSFNRSVWDRWDAMTPAEQAAGFLEHDQILVEAFDSLTPEQLEALQVPVGFLPAPVSVATYTGLRLGEVAHHSWDARVALDVSAALLDVSTAVLPEHLSGDLALLLGFLGKPDQVQTPVVLDLRDSGYSIAIGDGVTLASTGVAATATFAGPLEAALRLVTGRLAPQYTPAGVAVSGNVTLAELRAVFPGF